MNWPVEPRPGQSRRGMRIGLLGGSFNPAHHGHRFISLRAMRQLRLDQVWWLVSPQNPLKSRQDMAGLDRRVQRAQAVANHPRIIVTALEERLGTRYTADTLPRLQTAFPGTRFVWLMGADNLQQLPRWDRWTEILHTMPVAVLARPSWHHPVLCGRVARRYARYRHPLRAGSSLARQKPPAWIFLFGQQHPESASRIRARGEWTAAQQ